MNYANFIVSNQKEVCLFDLILYVPSTIFVKQERSSWVEPVLS